MVWYGTLHWYSIVWYNIVEYVIVLCGIWYLEAYCKVWSWSVGGGGRVISGNHWPLGTPILVAFWYWYCMIQRGAVW